MPYKSKRINKIDEDIAIAAQLCENLRSGSNRKSIVKVYDAYHKLFFNFIRKKLYDSEVFKPDDVFMSFWEKLMNGKVFCEYKAKGGVSLRNYLCSVLYKHIIDSNRKIERDRKRAKDVDNIENVAVNAGKSPKTPENVIIENELKEEEKRKIKSRELVQEIRSLLSEYSPKDENYIRMHYLEGLSYPEVAIRELGKQADQKEIKKKTDAIRKQVTRKRTGSMARFRNILERLMKDKNLSYKDILG